jgi:hypothetical protein
MRGLPVTTPDLPAGLSDGIFTSVEPDGRVKFSLMRRRRPVGDVTLPAAQAGQLAANALAGAYEAHDKAQAGLVPAGERQESYPFVRITGLGLGPCPIEGHACLVIRVGTAELGFAFPKAKLKEFAKWVAANEALDK